MRSAELVPARVLDMRVGGVDELVSLAFFLAGESASTDAWLVGRTLDGMVLSSDFGGEEVASSIVPRLVRALARQYVLDMAVVLMPAGGGQVRVVSSDGLSARVAMGALADGGVSFGESPAGMVVDPAKILPLDVLREHTGWRENAREWVRSRSRWVWAFRSERVGSDDPREVVMKRALERAEDASFGGLLAFAEEGNVRVVDLSPFGVNLRPHVQEWACRVLVERASVSSAVVALPIGEGRVGVVDQSPVWHVANTYVLVGGVPERVGGYMGENPLGFMALGAVART